jgi:hypothetical protein
MFRASLCPSSGAYQLQHQPLVYRGNVVVAVLLAVVGPIVSSFGFCFFNVQKFDFLVYTELNCCFHAVVALSIVSIYPYVNVVRSQFLFSACFIKPDYAAVDRLLMMGIRMPETC